MRKTLTAAVAVLATLAFAPNAAAALPSLSRPDAERYAAQAVVQPISFWAPMEWTFSTIRCRQRINDHHLRCAASLGIGDTEAYGRVRIWYTSRRGELWWDYAYRLTVLDTYCRIVQRRPFRRCSKVRVVR